MAYTPNNPNGQATGANSAPVVIASDQTALPTPPNIIVSGTLSASDAVVGAPIGDGTLISGTSTTGSVLYTTIPDGFQAWTMLLKNYSSGAVYTEASNNTTNGIDGDWVEIKGRKTGTSPGTESVVYAMVANGYYRGNAAGFKAIRARLIGGTGVTIQLVLSFGQGATFLNSGIPQGSSTIGSIALVSSVTNGTALLNRPDSVLRIAMDPTSLMLDTFETLDTSIVWNASGTVPPTAASGQLTVSCGTAVSATSILRTQYAFTNGAGGFVNYVSVFTLETAAILGNKRVWGLGIPAATPTVAVPITNGTVFELQDTDGAMVAAIYSNSVRTQAIPLTRPTSGTPMRYAIYYRASRVYFELEGIIVASVAYPNPVVGALAVVAISVNAAAGAPATAALLLGTVSGVGDTSRNNTAISDGVRPYLKGTVLRGGVAAASADNSQVVALHPTSPLPVGANVIGGVTQSGTWNFNLATSSGTVPGVIQVISAAIVNTPGTPTTVSGTGQAIAAVGSSGNATFHIVTTAFVGTLVFEASLDAGTNYAPIMCVREDGTGAEVSTAINTASAFIRAYTVGLPGFTHFRVRCSVFTSGTMAMVINQGPFLIETNPSLAASTAVIGSAKITDGTNNAAVKAASTAAVAVDPAVVVTISPNTPLPAGSNTIGAIQFNDFSTGDITITAQNLVPTGAATAGSAAAFFGFTGQGTFMFQISGTWTGKLTAQGTINGNTTVWNNLVGLIDLQTNTPIDAIPSGGVGFYAINAPGVYNIRLTALGAQTGTATIKGRGSVTGGYVTTLPVTPTPFSLSSAASTNSTLIKALPGTMFGITVSNSGAAAAFLKLYNLATAPVVGSTVPVLTIPIPASGLANPYLGNLGHRFTAGIGLAITNLVADTDTTAVTANQVKVILDYT